MTHLRYARAAVVAALSLSAGVAEADVNLATGLDPTGAVQAVGGSLDANWTVAGAIDTANLPNAYVVDATDSDWYGGWLANGANSSWIAANPFDGSGNGAMTFTRSFYVATPGTAAIDGGAWTLDDGGTLTLNGDTLASLSSGDWGQLNAFSTAPDDFVQGWNQLVIQITSTDDFLEGVRLEGILTGAGSAAPEAATWAMMLAGLAGLGLAGYRRGRTPAIVD